MGIIENNKNTTQENNSPYEAGGHNNVTVAVGHAIH